MQALLWWRLLKFIALVLVAAGGAGAFMGRSLEARQRAVYLVATSGLGLMWTAGYGLVQLGGWSLGAPWISGGVLLSLLWLQILVWAVEREDRRGPWLQLSSWATLTAALALMVWKPMPSSAPAPTPTSTELGGSR